MTLAYLSLGSNKGESLKLIEQAISFLGLCDDIKIVRTSAVYETEPWGVKDQNWFLNVVVEIKTNLSAQDLLLKCQSVEKTLGRNREKEFRWGERPIDIDIIFYNSEIIDSDTLTIPHCMMHKRAFVLVPMLELIPEFIHPVLNKTILQIHNELNDIEEVYLYGTRDYE